MTRTARRLLLLILLSSPPVAGQVPGPAPESGSLAVPGGVAGLARALDVSEDLPGSRVLLTAIRLLWEAPEGVDPASDGRRARVLEYLRGVDDVRVGPAATPEDRVPAFLPPETWLTIPGDAVARQASPFVAILADRRTALLYHGIASLDAPTLEYLVAHPNLLQQVSEDRHAAIFATFGRSLRVREGVLLVPGGADAVPLWEEVAGARASDPGAFIPRLLGRDGGRLALLYDGIAHLDEDARRFALGLALPAGQRRARFRAFYDAAGAALSRWQPDKRPFERLPFDAVHLLLSMTFGATGAPAGPSALPFWKAVFDPRPLSAGELDAAVTGQDAPLDAAALVELVAVGDPVERQERTTTYLFAQRVFPAPAA
ncbi:MAG TPA: hypothetical protein VK911_16730, partial [Vicinamibacterales bacterium]|nr:hypothetical protein [Vicinamibacterales bacterium]